MQTPHDRWLNDIPDDDDIPEGFDTWEEYKQHCAEIASEERYERRR